MMDSMWNLDLDDNTLVSVPPAQVVIQQCKYLEQITEGRVFAKVPKYSGSLNSFELTTAVDKPRPLPLRRYNPNTVDAIESLDDLGNVSDMYLTYEFFLSSPITPRYKYRIMLFSYVVGQYPVDIILAEDIAFEVQMEVDFSCASEEDFVNVLARVINSKKVKQVIKALNEMSKQGIPT